MASPPNPTEPEPTDPDTAELLKKITGVVSRVILETTGRSVWPEPDAKLLDSGLLDAANLTPLHMALESDLGITLDAGDLNATHAASVTELCALVQRRA